MNKVYPFAQQIIDICGGVPRVAAICGLTHATVHKWKYERGKSNGYGGLVPSGHALRLLEHGWETGEYDLAAVDFFRLREPTEQETAA